MSLVQNGGNDMVVASKLRLPCPYYRGGTHFKDRAVAHPVINFFQNFFLMFVQLLRAIKEDKCFIPTSNIKRSRKFPYSFPLHPSVLYA